MNSSHFKFRVAVCTCFLIIALTACAATPGLTVRGRLIDKKGEPVVSEQIILGRYRNAFDQYHSFSIPSIGGTSFGNTTDDHGIFQIQSGEAGEYLLLYTERTDGEESIHTLLDKNGQPIIVELSEKKGVSVGTITLLTYPELPKKYLPSFLSGIFLGMSLDEFEVQKSNPEQAVLTKDHIYYDETEPGQGVDKITYGFDTETNHLNELKIWYTEDTSAYNFCEESFGIPNYQEKSGNDGSVIYWRFNFGDSQVVAKASEGMLEFYLERP